MTAPFAALTTAVIDGLEAAGLLVGDGGEPAGAGWQGAAGQSDYNAYAAVHPLLGGIGHGSMGDPNGDHEIIYQVSCVANTRLGCEIVAGIVHETILALRPTLPAHTVRFVDDDVLGGARRDDDVQPPIWQSTPRYRFYLAPTS